jgi:hypothetical protein
MNEKGIYQSWMMPSGNPVCSSLDCPRVLKSAYLKSARKEQMSAEEWAYSRWDFDLIMLSSAQFCSLYAQACCHLLRCAPLYILLPLLILIEKPYYSTKYDMSTTGHDHRPTQLHLSEVPHRAQSQQCLPVKIISIVGVFLFSKTHRYHCGSATRRSRRLRALDRLHASNKHNNIMRRVFVLS